MPRIRPTPTLTSLLANSITRMISAPCRCCWKYYSQCYRGRESLGCRILRVPPAINKTTQTQRCHSIAASDPPVSRANPSE
ncbi:uncharacterized protein BKA55DRAFT_682034 [Fusarium redolens]|uniref:Uncharacterized protein n=1 Tax=Fusarium redolens TaxID=48865 RepID=A0A9P9FV01_FUSRE|nr:uncharacterized protein BKA55DRAFT_682034 [Fusarium redolens]KAH7202693.1 hypothetical protein BKA55DRAFT_682034 [Fusarium redolens]